MKAALNPGVTKGGEPRQPASPSVLRTLNGFATKPSRDELLPLAIKPCLNRGVALLALFHVNSNGN